MLPAILKMLPPLFAPLSRRDIAPCVAPEVLGICVAIAPILVEIPGIPTFVVLVLL